MSALAVRVTPAPPPPAPDVVAAVKAVLSVPDAELDYARAKIALDALVDPSVDAEWVLGELDRLTRAAKVLAGAGADEIARLRAVRTVIYESGPWNDFRPFSYEMSDPRGEHLPNKLLHKYLKTRLGQCVSMPILFLIIGDRLELNLALAHSPNHYFIRFTAADRTVWNLETTSGALPARLEWFQQETPMTDRALSSGFYMRSLPRREAVAVMALIAAEHLGAEQRWSEVAAICNLIIEVSPRSIALVIGGSAYGRMHKAEFEDKYSAPFLIPERLRWRRLFLTERNNSLIDAAEHLGWVPTELDMP